MGHFLWLDLKNEMTRKKIERKMRVVNQMLASVTTDSLTQQNEMIEEEKIERTDGRVCDI